MKHSFSGILILICISFGSVQAKNLKSFTRELDQRTKKLAMSHHRSWKELRRLHEEINIIKKNLTHDMINVTPVDLEAIDVRTTLEPSTSERHPD